MALSRRNQRLGCAYDPDKISDARVAEVVMMDISPNRDAACPRNFSLPGFSFYF